MPGGSNHGQSRYGGMILLSGVTIWLGGGTRGRILTFQKGIIWNIRVPSFFTISLICPPFQSFTASPITFMHPLTVGVLLVCAHFIVAAIRVFSLNGVSSNELRSPTAARYWRRWYNSNVVSVSAIQSFSAVRKTRGICDAVYIFPFQILVRSTDRFRIVRIRCDTTRCYPFSLYLYQPYYMFISHLLLKPILESLSKIPSTVVLLEPWILLDNSKID